VDAAAYEVNSTVPAAAPAEAVTMIVVADDPCDCLAIQRSFPHGNFYFASTFEEAEALVRCGVANGFYVF